jgi:hypothetical protein
VTSDEDRQHAQEAEHRGLADVLAALGVAGVDTRALDADEHERGDDHGVADLVAEVAEVAVPGGGPVVREHPGVQRDQQHHDEDQDWKDLEHRHDPVDDRGVAHAPRDQQVEHPDADGRQCRRQDRVAVAEAAEERAERGADEHPVERVARHRTGPEPDGGVEAGVVAEPGLGVDEHTGVEIGLADRQVLEDEGQHQHAGAGDRPGDQ